MLYRYLFLFCILAFSIFIGRSPVFATGLPEGAFKIAQTDTDEEELKKKRAEQRQKAKQQQNEKSGPNRAKKQRREEQREQQQQRKALREQRQREKAVRDESQRRRTIEADRQRQQQLREERDRQQAIREERQRQRARREQQAESEAQERQRALRQDSQRQQAERDLRRRQIDNRRERQRDRDTIVKETDQITVRTRKRIDRRGRVQYATSRHYRVHDRRYRNRYRNGISIYFLPPRGINLAPDYYILDGSRASYRDYVDLFGAPPVIDIPRRYTLDEIISDPEVRGYVRSVNVDMITFDSGSSYITDDQLYQLDDLANAMLETLQDDPYAKFLIEGYTDATGSDETNLLLSEDRAAAVQSALIEEYGIPADNLDAVGYGEQYLLVDTLGPERRNRRVTIRPIGDLLADAR